jgi:Cu2+-exporting ATPase
MSINQATINASKITPYVCLDENGLQNLSLSLEGVHCANCIRKIESSLLQLPDVTYARLNFSTKRLQITWKGQPEFSNRICNILSDLGYKATAFDPTYHARGSEEEGKFLLLCLGVAGFAAGNIMLMSFALWTSSIQDMGIPVRDFLHWISALIAIPAIAFSGRPFFSSAYQAVRSGRTNMDVPISVALILTAGVSLFELSTHGEHAYFDSAVMLMFFLLIGRYLDYLARSSARKAARDLLSYMSGTSMLVENGQYRNILIRDIIKNMTLLISMGERIPADSVIIEGQTDIDTSLVTGESLPCPAGEGSQLMSGTLNLTAPILIKALRNPEESQLSGMIRLMEKAEHSQSKYIKLAERIARFYTPVVHLLAMVSFLGWILILNAAWQDSLLIAATVLIITCPCALALAIPVVHILATGSLMRRGIFVKSGEALERLSKIDTIILDKTGTITMGQPVLINAPSIDQLSFKLAASIAAHSRHPLSKALSDEYKGLTVLLKVEEFPGYGLQTTYMGKTLRLGRRDWATHEHLTPFPDYMEIVLAGEEIAPVSFLFKDIIRGDAADVVTALEDRGMEIHMFSGDKPNIVEEVAKLTRIKNFKSDMTPEEKYIEMVKLRARGKFIMMVGDGLNDAPTLAGADVSVSPSTAIDIAKNAANVVFTGSNLSALIKLLDTSKVSQKLVRQNLAMTFTYNIIAIPVAMAGLITPLIAAAAMSLSSLAVTLNAFRLRSIK